MLIHKPENKEKPDLNWLHEIPKTDVHCHLGGSLRLDTILDLAKENHVELPTTDPKVLSNMVCMKGANTLTQYLGAFEITESVLTTTDALQRGAFEVCEDAAKENVVYLEIRFGPTNYEKYGLTLPEIVESVLGGMRAAEKEYEIKTGLIICGIRTDKKATRRAAEIAVNYQNRGVVGFDLAGAEYGNRPKDFVEAFKPVLDNYLSITVHAGEAYGAVSIDQAIYFLRANRIGHGTSLQEDVKLYEYINNHRIALEMCISSNMHTGAISSMATHPIRRYLNDGLRVCVNTDNRLVSNTTVTNELDLLVKHLGFTKGAIKKMLINGVKAGFMPMNMKTRFLNEFDEQLNKM